MNRSKTEIPDLITAADQKQTRAIRICLCDRFTRGTNFKTALDNTNCVFTWQSKSSSEKQNDFSYISFRPLRGAVY